MQEFTDILYDATKSISVQYFQLPVAGQELTIYRERVYCYELYHQIRTRWPMDTPYLLGGEIDKNGHPFIRGNYLDRTKPDFLIHVPGQMDDNKLVMEVKTIKSNWQSIKKDLLVLTAYRKSACYQRAIFLVYGNSQRGINRFKQTVRSIADKNTSRLVDVHLIELWHHSSCGQGATKIEW